MAGIGLFVLLIFGVLISSAIRDKREAKIAAAEPAKKAQEPPVPIIPATPVPPPTMAELTAKAQPFLSLSRDSYESADPNEFDAVMVPLRDIPKESKDYKAAQALNKKLIDKSSVVFAERIVLGPKPINSEWDGGVQPVKDYLKASLNDYDSSEFVEWSPVVKTYVGKEPYWVVRLKLRAKNGFGALILRDTYYFIQNGQVVKAEGLGG